MLLNMIKLFPSPFSNTCTFSLLLVIILISSETHAQFTISDTINRIATPIVGINPQTNSVVVEVPTDFRVSDKVLLIKMQGTLIDETNDTQSRIDTDFGTISNINGVGLYEISTICSILGNEISFQNQMINNYAPLGTFSGKMQMIKIPQYFGDVTVTDTLTAPAWNGSTGGILIFESTGTVTLNQDIDMSGKGFRGGRNINSAYTCIPSVDGVNAVENSANSYYRLESGEGACKGEGIAEYITNKEGGKGNQANGGGGGNNLNAGGGGGGNYGIGGKGGIREKALGEPISTCRGSFFGESGTFLSGYGYSAANNRIFMGGGGGAGHADNGEGQNGGNGGGIVIIIAHTFNGNGYAIRANGADGLNSGNDGGPGGGAGGVVLFDVQFLRSPPLRIEVRGGNGGGASHAGSDCNGPGGGGGGGFIWSKNPFGVTVTRDFSEGIYGLTAASSGCGAGGVVINGASVGHVGAYEFGLNIPQETAAFTSCILGAELLNFHAKVKKKLVELSWHTSSETNQDLFVLERSVDGNIFEQIAELNALGSSGQGANYQWTDNNPYVGTSYYRLKQLDVFGNFTYSEQVEVSVGIAEKFYLKAFPNPIERSQGLQLNINQAKRGRIKISLTNMIGQEVLAKVFEISSGQEQLSMSIENLSAGTYMLSAQQYGYSERRRIVVF